MDYLIGNKSEVYQIENIKKIAKNTIENVKQKEREYKDKQIYTKKFVGSLTDLQIFKDAGWSIKYTGIEDENGKIRYE